MIIRWFRLNIYKIWSKYSLYITIFIDKYSIFNIKSTNYNIKYILGKSRFLAILDDKNKIYKGYIRVVYDGDSINKALKTRFIPI